MGSFGKGQFDLIFGELRVKCMNTRYGVRIDRREIKSPGCGDSRADGRDKKFSQDVSFLMMRGKNRAVSSEGEDFVFSKAL